MNKRILTAESVTEGHPDKLCDLVADNSATRSVVKNRRTGE